jgi:hypothetical protein
MAELRSQTGRPNAIRFDETGGQVWEYNDRRTGWGAFAVTFDARGTVVQVRQLRTPELVARVRPGETRAQELLDLLGEPHRLVFAGDDPVWEYCQPTGERLRVRLGPGQTVAEVGAWR